jgi:phosphoenolpyruvate-protein kinase (PTS system EI component)
MFMKNNKIAQGASGVPGIVAGRVLSWTDSFLLNPSRVTGHIIFSPGETPLYRVAFLIDHDARAVLFEKGGKNYHPLILLNDAMLPGVAGLGNIKFNKRSVVVDSGAGIIYEGKAAIKNKNDKMDGLKLDYSLKTSVPIYANVGYPLSIRFAAQSGADGIGLLRTEFVAASALLNILNKNIGPAVSIKNEIEISNEADTIYKALKSQKLYCYFKSALGAAFEDAAKWFPEKEVIIRTLDIARKEDDYLGNRGIRRCLSEGGDSIRLIADALKYQINNSSAGCRFGIILPLVSHYSQIRSALKIILDAGLGLRKIPSSDPHGIGFGWEIEQPAASENNEIWINAFISEFGQPPHYIGIGTNDLTQYTLALGRNAYAMERAPIVRDYLKSLYDEKDISIIKQIYDISRQGHRFGVRLFLLGEAAVENTFAKLIYAFGIIPSVSVRNIFKMRGLIHELESTHKKRKEILNEFIESASRQYPMKTRFQVKLLLNKTFKTGLMKASDY